MNNSEDNINSLGKTLEQITPLDCYCPSIHYLVCAVEVWEANIEQLEKRLRHIQQEIENLQRTNNKS